MTVERYIMPPSYFKKRAELAEARVRWLEQRLENIANLPADWDMGTSNVREYARYTLNAHETTHTSADDQ